VLMMLLVVPVGVLELLGLPVEPVVLGVGEADPELADGVGVGVAVVGVAGGVVKDGVVDGLVGGVVLGGVVGVGSGSHCCWLLPEEAAASCASLPLATRSTRACAAASPKLDADTTRKPPAARLTAGRTCRAYAKRMNALPVLFVAPAERVFSME
jgi:hypothetical protein